VALLKPVFISQKFFPLITHFEMFTITDENGSKYRGNKAKQATRKAVLLTFTPHGMEHLCKVCQVAQLAENREHHT
jgi:hypothetical protein